MLSHGLSVMNVFVVVCLVQFGLAWFCGKGENRKGKETKHVDDVCGVG